MFCRIGIGGTWQVALRLHKVLEEFPKNTTKITENLWRHKLQLEADVNVLHNSTVEVLNSVSKTVDNLPKDAMKVFNYNIQQNFHEAAEKYAMNKIAFVKAYSDIGRHTAFELASKYLNNIQ